MKATASRVLTESEAETGGKVEETETSFIWRSQCLNHEQKWMRCTDKSIRRNQTSTSGAEDPAAEKRNAQITNEKPKNPQKT